MVVNGYWLCCGMPRECNSQWRLRSDSEARFSRTIPRSQVESNGDAQRATMWRASGRSAACRPRPARRTWKPPDRTIARISPTLMPSSTTGRLQTDRGPAMTPACQTRPNLSGTSNSASESVSAPVRVHRTLRHAESRPDARAARRTAALKRCAALSRA